MNLPMTKPKVADLFAGFGGMSVGAEMGGAEVTWAGNHWEQAVEVHRLNLPNAYHVCQNLHETDFTLLPDIDIMVAAPACPPYSTASQPNRIKAHDDQRAMPWTVVDAAEAKRPEHIVIENVLGFANWDLFPAWKLALKLLGYDLEQHLLTASNFGVPQRRKRIFIVGSLNGKPNLEFELDEHEPGSGTIIEDTDEGWKKVKNAGIQAQKRIATGRERWGDEFFSQHTTGHKGVPFDQPLRTLTTKDHWIRVKGDEYRPLSVAELKAAMGFPLDYKLPEGSKRNLFVPGFGNAVCPPVAKAIIEAIQ